MGERVTDERLAELERYYNSFKQQHLSSWYQDVRDCLRELQHRRASGGAEDALDYKLPCEVRLPPATTFGVGVSLRTVVHGMKRRTEQHPAKFTDSPDLSGIMSPFQKLSKAASVSPEPSGRQPDGYAYRYPDGCIRFSGGREINGSDPMESIPYYFRRSPEPVGGQWQPIETAPKDGTWFVAYSRGTHWRTLAQYLPNGALACQSLRQQTSQDPSPTHWAPCPYYSLTKPAEYPAYTECQHDHMKPNPTLRATYPKHGSQSGWVQEYRCNVCQCSFERPIATAGLRANGETP